MKRISILLLFVPFMASAQSQSSCCTSSTEEFASLVVDAKFVNAHLEPLPLAYHPDKGSFITIKTTDSIEARLFVVKADKPTENVLLVFHEWWGLNEYIQRECESLQKELVDATVIGVDLYDGKVVVTRQDAGKIMQGVKEDRARTIIDAAIKYVGAKSKVATIGWCFGGGWSLQASLIAGSQAVACVMYYGMPEKDIEKLKKLNAPVLGIFAGKEQWISPKIVAEFEQNMMKAGKSVTTKSYDADHAFANPSNLQYDAKATEDAHKLVMAFLTKHLLKR